MATTEKITQQVGTVLLGTRRALETIDQFSNRLTEDYARKEFLFQIQKELGAAIRHATSIEVLSHSRIEEVFQKQAKRGLLR